METDNVIIRRTIIIGKAYETSYIAARGANLHVIEEHSAEFGLPNVSVHESRDGDAIADITWPNGDYCRVHVNNYARAQGYFAWHAERVTPYAYKRVTA